MDSNVNDLAVKAQGAKKEAKRHYIINFYMVTLLDNTIFDVFVS